MNNLAVRNVVRILLFVLAQVMVFKSIHLGTANFNYISLIVYPVAIMLLPLDYPKIAVLLIAFVIGISVDMFYDSPGVHAAAAVFMAYLRPMFLKILAPETGYSKNVFPVASSFGLIWYIQYASYMLAAYLIIYFSIEAFTFVYIKEIILKSVFSFIASIAIIILHQILINPRR